MYAREIKDKLLDIGVGDVNAFLPIRQYHMLFEMNLVT